MKRYFPIISGLLLWMTAVIFASPAGAQNYNWTGFYVGAQAGLGKPRDVVRYRGSSTGIPFNDDDEIIKHRENGFAGGVQAGYNLQLGFLVPGAILTLAVGIGSVTAIFGILILVWLGWDIVVQVSESYSPQA